MYDARPLSVLRRDRRLVTGRPGLPAPRQILRNDVQPSDLPNLGCLSQSGIESIASDEWLGGGAGYVVVARTLRRESGPFWGKESYQHLVPRHVPRNVLLNT